MSQDTWTARAFDRAFANSPSGVPFLPSLAALAARSQGKTVGDLTRAPEALVHGLVSARSALQADALTVPRLSLPPGTASDEVRRAYVDAQRPLVEAIRRLGVSHGRVLTIIGEVSGPLSLIRHQPQQVTAFCDDDVECASELVTQFASECLAAGAHALFLSDFGSSREPSASLASTAWSDIHLSCVRAIANIARHHAAEVALMPDLYVRPLGGESRPPRYVLPADGEPPEDAFGGEPEPILGVAVDFARPNTTPMELASLVRDLMARKARVFVTSHDDVPADRAVETRSFMETFQSGLA